VRAEFLTVQLWLAHPEAGTLITADAELSAVDRVTFIRQLRRTLAEVLGKVPDASEAAARTVIARLRQGGAEGEEQSLTLTVRVEADALEKALDELARWRAGRAALRAGIGFHRRMAAGSAAPSSVGEFLPPGDPPEPEVGTWAVVPGDAGSPPLFRLTLPGEPGPLVEIR
jgi:hypothetical protein